MDDISSSSSECKTSKSSSSSSSSFLASCSSFRLRRSRSSALYSGSIPSESARFTSYERISHSMRLDDEPFPSSIDWSDDESRRKGDGGRHSRRRRNRALSSKISRLFSFLRPSARDGEREAGSEKRSARRRKSGSNWLPDPNRRWPVQGWG